MREEFSLPFTSGWKALFAFMRVVREGFVGEVGVQGQVGEVGVVEESAPRSSSSMLVVEDEEVEVSLLLREEGCKAHLTAAI